MMGVHDFDIKKSNKSKRLFSGIPDPLGNQRDAIAGDPAAAVSCARGLAYRSSIL